MRRSLNKRRAVWQLIGLACAACWLSACSAPPASNLPSPVPSEMLSTLAAQTMQAIPPSPTASPTATLSEAEVYATQEAAPTATRTVIPSRTPSLTPSITPSPTASHTPSNTPTPTISPTVTITPRPVIPPGTIRINRPGPLSRLVSPIALRAILPTGAGGNLRVELLGEDGRILYRQVLRYPGDRVNLSINIEFAIPGVAEAARLQLATEDVYGRPLALASVDVILLSVGETELNPAGDLRERIYVIEPAAYQPPEDRDDPPPVPAASGGTLNVFGKVRWAEQQSLLVELIAEDGRVVGQRLVNVNPEDGEDYAIFTGDIPYQVSQPTLVRLVITERLGRIPGPSHISTLEILLDP